MAKITVISTNFLVWKFCGKAQFPHLPKYMRKLCLSTKFPHQDEITVFYAVNTLTTDVSIVKLPLDQSQKRINNLLHQVSFLSEENEIKMLMDKLLIGTYNLT